MVKGVNKTVIEVNNTGSEIFDRIVFYVSPACSNLSVKNLNQAIKSFTFQLDERAGKGYKTIRQKHLVRRKMFLLGLISVAIIGLGITTVLIL